VKAGSSSDELGGELIEVSLDDCPSFKAVSYTWGDSTSRESFLCNEIGIQITQSSATALRYLRSASGPSLFWLDALCINQADTHEKSVQVYLMPEIYSKASQVQIWLGEESTTSAEGMEVLSCLIGGRTGIEVLPHWSQKPPQQVRDGIKDVLSRQWWTRGWVVQEAALSKRTDIICGHHRISWQSEPSRIRQIIREIKLAEISFEWTENGLDGLPMHVFLDLLQAQLRQCEPTTSEIEIPVSKIDLKPDIVDLMHDFRDKKFADPRDRIYAMLGMVSDVNIVPDYYMSVRETWETFMQAVEIRAPSARLEHSKSIDGEHVRKYQRTSSPASNPIEISSEEFSGTSSTDETIVEEQNETRRLRKIIRTLRRDNMDLSNVNQTLRECLKDKVLA
jgi:hypothetical protein